MVLGEMDVARMNPYRSGQGETPSAHGLDCTPPARGVTQFRGGGSIGGLPLSQWTTSARPGLLKALGDGGLREWRGQKEGSMSRGISASQGQ